jgi:hypothetical protein
LFGNWRISKWEGTCKGQIPQLFDLHWPFPWPPPLPRPHH